MKKDKADFSSVYEEQFSAVYNYVYAQLLDRERAEDLVSDIFYKAFINYDKFDPSIASVRTWLTHIARNTLIDYFRGKGRRDTASLSDENVQEPSSTDHYDIMADPVNKEVRFILHRLTPAERELLGMIYFEDLKNPQIAAILGITPKAVSERHRRLLSKCRDIEKGKDLTDILE